MIKRKYAYIKIDNDNINFEDVENTITYSLSAKNLENNLNKREEELCNKIAELEAKLAEKERQYEMLYKLFSEQHEIIDQNELECFEEVNRLLKEQKDFCVVEKVEYDKMKQGAKDIVEQLKQQLAEKDKEIEDLKIDLKDYMGLEEK